jgi:hypothetical protein
MNNNKEKAVSDNDYLPYQKGAKYAGAEKLLETEWEYLEKNRKNFDRNNIKGIALSGGGIRSASFCLGVMQALAHRDKLKQFDYLSTVSGGGYLGGALSWLWSGLWKDKATDYDLGVGKENFPLGTEARNFSHPDQPRNRNQASLLRHFQQHGKYLTPGKGITALSFVSIILRSIVMGFVSMIVLASFIFSLFYVSGLFALEDRSAGFFASLALLFGSFYLLLHFAYIVFLSWHKKNQNPTSGYRWRRKFETWLPVFLKIILFSVVAFGIHYVQVSLHQRALELGGVSALLGALLGGFGSHSKWGKVLAFIPKSMQMILAAALMVFGLLVLADFGASSLHEAYPETAWLISAVLAVVVIVLAKFLPINNISIHRYYRDRLMETFMPDVEKVFAGKDAREAIRANATGVHEVELNPENPVPYHLINTNIILVESAISKFRGRGGDNFILSPLYSGSNATGWRKTEHFCNGGITLPSAVAISGAAANPDSGVAGQGLTMNSMISILMSIFNLRLGYWASNPDPQCQPDQGKMPSYLSPGFWEVVRRKKMNESAEFVQLSDGGHFENLALYELFRRKAKLIIVCDAGADPQYRFDDLANAIEKARVDFGVTVKLDREQLEKMVPGTKPQQHEMDYPLAETAWLKAEVDYHDGNDASKGTLLYIKTTLPKGISADIHGYKRANPDFPDQTTVDQFFDEVQFEAYRELGWQIASDMLEDDGVKQEL